MNLLNKNKMCKLAVIFALIFTLVSISGCSGKKQQGQINEEKDNKKLTLIHNFKAGSLDPNNNMTPLRAGVTETLIRLDENLELKPWLAEAWETEDNKTWTFNIRKGITFQDGIKLDGAAVKSSLERTISVNEAFSNSLKIESMEAKEQQLIIVTKEAHPELPSNLVNPFASIVSVAAENKMGTEEFNKAPVGTGPFKVKQFNPNIDILLERNDDYWDGKAKVKEVSFKFNEDGNVRALALQSKEADIVYQVPAETVEVIEKSSDLQIASVTGLRVHFILFNHNKPILQDVKVRKAIDLLLDRNSMAKDIVLGHASPANGPFNSALPFGNKEEVQKLDIERAKKLLEEAGFKADGSGTMMKDGKPLSLELITYKGRPELPIVAQLIQSDAAKAGIKIQIKTVENSDAYLRDNKDWDLATYSNLSAPRGDGGYFLNSALMAGGSLNAVNISSERLSPIVTELNSTSDITKRIEITKDAVKVVNEEVLHSYAIYPNVIVGINKRVVDWKPGAEEYYLVTNRMDVK